MRDKQLTKDEQASATNMPSQQSSQGVPPDLAALLSGVQQPPLSMQDQIALQSGRDPSVAPVNPVQAQMQGLAKGGVIQSIKGMKRDPEPARPKDVDKSHTEKIAAIYKAMGVKYMADGGTPDDDSVGQSTGPVDMDPMESPVVPPPPAPGTPAWETWIKNALSQVSNSPLAKVAGVAVNPVEAMTDAVSKYAPKIVAAEEPVVAPAVDKFVGANVLPTASAPDAPSESDQLSDLINRAGSGTSAADLATTPSSNAPAPSAPSAPTAPTPNPLAQLGQSNPAATVTPGMNAQDRNNLAAQGMQNQHSFANYLSEALGGIGDAIAAKGGVQQNSLGSIFAMQKQQRDEALANFDKARESAVQNFQMKNQADQSLIEQVKAKNELGPLPDSITSAMGIPKGSTPAQANILIGMNNARIEHQDKAAQLQIDSAKQASDEYDHLPTASRILNGENGQSTWITNRTNDLMNKAMGNVKVTNGQQTGYVSQADYLKNKASLQQVPF